MSIQQIAREMPSLAMGPQMFFLAISNNLPIFADEVKRARVEYDNLVKSGEKGVPVWKQILSSLFSWQTALTTGIMLLVMYGDELVGWVKGLFSAKDGVDALKKSPAGEKRGRERRTCRFHTHPCRAGQHPPRVERLYRHERAGEEQGRRVEPEIRRHVRHLQVPDRVV